MNDAAQPLAGRVVLITGGGRGLGRAHALAFAALGARVVVNDYGGSSDGTGRSTTPADEVVEEIRAMGGNAYADAGNVADPDDAAMMIERAVREFGGLHTLVNNAGILRDKSLLKMTIEDWTLVVDVHLRGTFVMTQAAGRYWRDAFKAGNAIGGRIVNTTSGSGLFGNFGQANYSSAKGGIASLTISTAIELARYGVTANCIAPIGKTRMIPDAALSLSARSPEDFDPFDPANVSPLVTWLGSDSSGEVTGRLFSVVGGYVGMIEGYSLGPGMQRDRRLTFADIDAALPAIVSRCAPPTPVTHSHPYATV